MSALWITMDDVVYRLHVEYPSLQRSFAFVDGGQGGTMQSGRDTLDTIGTKYLYSLKVQPDRRHHDDYDAFFYAISSPQRVHTVTLPFGQTTMTFDCRVEGGTDTMGDMDGDDRSWGEMTVNFTPMAPQRMAEDE